MSLHAAIATLLTTDPGLVAALSALNLGSGGGPAVPKVLKSMRPLRSIGQEHFPCWVQEVGDIQTSARAIGSCHQEAQREILLALIWHQQDPNAAFDQMAALWDVVVALFLRTPSPDGEATVHVDALVTDRYANHPTHIAVFRLLADTTTTPQ